MINLKQILIGSIAGAVLSFNSGCSSIEGLDYAMKRWSGQNNNTNNIEYSSSSTSNSEQVYTYQKEADNQKLANDSLTTRQFLERNVPALKPNALFYSTNSEFNEFFNYQQRLDHLEAEISKLADSEKMKLGSIKFENLQELESYLDSLQREVIEPSLRIEKEYRGIEAEQSPLIRQLNRREEGIRKPKNSQQEHFEERISFWKRVLESGRGNLDIERSHLRDMKREAESSDKSIQDEFIRAYESYASRYGHVYR